METPEPDVSDRPSLRSLWKEAGPIGSLICLMPFVLGVILAYWGTRYALAEWHLSLWLAVPVGLIVGALFVFLNSLGESALEAGVRATLILVVGLIWWLVLGPIFANARHKADLIRQREAAHARRRAP
jgi:amino acid transporter